MKTNPVVMMGNGYGFIPPGAKPRLEKKLPTINPFKKSISGTAISPSISYAFNHICQFGAEQLSACYNQENKDLSPLDFLDICSDCPYSINPNPHSVFYTKTDRYPFFISDFIHVEADSPKYYVYLITDGQYVKIGISDNPIHRINDLQVSNPRELSFICQIPLRDKKDALSLESYLHKVYHRFHVRGEWFNILDYIRANSWRDYFSESEESR